MLGTRTFYKGGVMIRWLGASDHALFVCFVAAF